MSAYVVSKSTIDRVVTVLAYTKQCANGGPLIRTMGGFPTDPILDACHDTDNASNIGTALWALNVKAVNGRYPSHAPEQVEPYRFKERPTTPIQGFKSLECLIYQCSEDATIDDPLMKELEAARDLIARHILHQSAEFNAARWE